MNKMDKGGRWLGMVLCALRSGLALEWVASRRSEGDPGL